MKIKHYLYNAFIIENDKVKIAIDPDRIYICSGLVVSSRSQNGAL